MVDLKPLIREKRWDVKREKEIIDLWKKEDLYTYTMDPKDKRPLLVIDTPPPYPSGKWHVAGAAHYSQIDMIARYFRLKGYNVVFPFYADRNGLPVEVKVEKTYNINAHEMASTPEGRRKFIQLCKSFLDEVEGELARIMEKMACSHTYWRDGTDSVKYRTMTQATFIDLWKRGLIYEDERPVRWCPRCKTTLAEAEVEYEERKGYLYTILYKLKETGEPLPVSTTRPELIASCKALAFNPEDDRYKHLEGKTAIAPIYGHELKILSHPQVDPEYGTGLMMVCSYGDEDDVRMFKELGLKPKVIIDEDGRLTSEAGVLAGLKVEEAREKIVEILEEQGLLVDKKEITHKVPVCWRCHTPIQIIHRREYFLKQMEYLPQLRKIVDQIDFKPEMHKRKLLDWMDSISMDWPISRDRYYGTEIPVWHCTSCGAKLVPEPGKYYRPWIDEPPFEKCPVCGAGKEKLVGEKKTFDTWFDSSVSMLYVTQWFYNREFYEKAKDNTLRPQGYEIIRTWLYYSLLRVYQLTGRPAFRWVRISGMGLDPKGRAMHKSLGNVVDPEPILDEEGADAFRYWAAASAKLGYDYRFNRDMIKTGRLFATKLWNIARFISSFPEPTENYELSSLDKAFLGLLDEYLERIEQGYDELDVFDPIHLIYEYTWNFFASHYLELSKKPAYNRDGRYTEETQRGAWRTLHQILRRILVVLSPIMPVVTDAIYRELYGESVHRQKWPKPAGYKDQADLAREIAKVDNAIWGEKRRLGLKLVEPLPSKVCVSTSIPSDALTVLGEFHKAEIETGDCEGREIAPGIKIASQA
ncbi:MAG: valine--tRNA ligase [Desulfurococcales archaeon]|nr:valine--tRNA ligase [Desulfurococcales archaeon]